MKTINCICLIVCAISIVTFQFVQLGINAKQVKFNDGVLAFNDSVLEFQKVQNEFNDVVLEHMGGEQ